jgi:glycosyltransferase involved in cell wall biosynthesis
MIKTGHDNRKKRVLFIVASLIRAGAETQVINLINSLDNNSFDKFLFTYHKRIDQYQRIDHENIRFYNKPKRRKLDLSVIRSIAAVIDNEKIDVVHCTNPYSLFMGWLAVKLSKSNPQLIVALHTTLIRSTKAKIIEKVVYRYLLRRCSHVIFVCRRQADFWISKYRFLKDKSTVVYNGIDTNHFNATGFQKQAKDLKSRLFIPDDAKIICCIARFRKEKAHDDLIEAFADLEDNVYLLLAGDGPRKQYIENLVKKKGLVNSVKFLGEVPDVRPVLAASDISVLSSTAVETFSIAMLESMSMGVPVVATDIGGLSEAIVPGETGETVRPGDPPLLAITISKMIVDEAKYIGMKKKCRELVADKFTTERMVSATAKILLSKNLQK